MSNWKDIGSNIIKLEGYGLYVTYIDSDLYTCPMLGETGHPRLDQDKCIDWEELTDPPNQEFLNLCNDRFETGFTMNSYNKAMSISDIKTHMQQQKDKKDGKDDGGSEDAS